MLVVSLTVVTILISVLVELMLHSHCFLLCFFFEEDDDAFSNL